MAGNSTPTAAEILPTPTLDTVKPSLLSKITTEGGYAYVSMATRGAELNDFRAAEAGREMAWEQLHSGPWHSVLPIWRDAYSMSCLNVASFQYSKGEVKEALRVLDMGVIMGGSLLRKDLDNAIELIMRSRASEEGDGRTDLDAGGGLNDAEVGKNYLCQDWKQELITFSQFLERIQINDPCGPTYLAQHPLFEQIQELRQDILVPDYCCVGGGELRSLNAWFGPSGTVTPLHHDPHHNILAQVVGRKYIRLYHASISEDLYPYTETMLCNSSQVDLDNLDTEEFPKAKDLDFMDCILEEGEMLYIPPKWWHYVRSLTTSFSVSFWWSESSS